MVPIVQKVLLELEGLDLPLNLWWPDETLIKFKKDIDQLFNSKVFRIPKTPSSIIEVNTNYFSRIIETEEYEIITPELCLENLELFRYLKEFGLPIPKSSFNDEFEYPSTMLAIKDKKFASVVKVDFSNYTNLDYLIRQGKSLLDHLNSNKEYLPSDFSSDRFIYAEYSRLKVP